MTETTHTLPAQLGLARLWRWLASRKSGGTPAAHLDTLSDHMRRDIGLPRDPIDQMAIRTLHDAMRYSG